MAAKISIYTFAHQAWPAGRACAATCLASAADEAVKKSSLILPDAMPRGASQSGKQNKEQQNKIS